MQNHHNYTDFDAAWAGCLKPWFIHELGRSWECKELQVVTCPNASLVALIKQRLVEEGLGGTGIQFTTPGSLRRLLASLVFRDDERAAVVLREDLHLIVRGLAARRGDDPVARAVVRDAASVVSALDALDAGGWSADCLKDGTVSVLGKSLWEILQRGGLGTVRQADRELLKAKGNRVMGSWLAFGFSSSEWSVMPLLHAAWEKSERRMLCLLSENERSGSAAWAGTWEEIAGSLEAQWGTESLEDRPYSAHVSRFQGHEKGDEGKINFIITQSLEAEIRGVMSEIAKALKVYPGGRIAVVLPHSNSLMGRELALRLANKGIPHHDQPGHRPARDPRHQRFNAWLNYQRDQTLTTYLEFLKELSRGGQLPRSQKSTQEQIWFEAFRDVMTEDMAVLAAYLEERGEAVLELEFYQSWPVLPLELTLTEALDVLKEPMVRLEWPESLQAFMERAQVLAEATADLSFSREAVLEWVAGIVDIPGRTRAACGREAFAPVQLITLSEAAGQPWDVVILVGMVHDDWPVNRVESPFMAERDMRELNGKALQAGSQGEGHIVVKPGHTLISTGTDNAARAEECLQLLMESTRYQLCATVSLRDPGDTSTLRQVSEWFLRLYAVDRGAWLEEKELFRLGNEGEAAFREALASDPEIQQKIFDVYERRRDPELPFDHYSFSYENPPKGGLRFSASAWDTVLTIPVTAWYRYVLRLDERKTPRENEPWHLTLGTWIHNWVRPNDKTQVWAPIPKLDEWLTKVEKRAQETRNLAESAYLRAGRALPDWWRAAWAQARKAALELVGLATQIDVGTYVACEVSLPENTQISMEGLGMLPLKGRMDLLLADRPYDFEAEPKGEGRLAVIDFKTGKQSDKLSVKKIMKDGKGAQIVLYAFALESLTGVDVEASLLHPGVELGAWIKASDVSKTDDIWKTIMEIHETGRIGDFGPHRPSHGSQPPRPLADLPIPAGILASKWNLTHQFFPVKGA